MQCPVCDEKMREVERMGVEVDICPGCKGVWLDRGELEKLIEFSRSNGPVSDVAAPAPQSQPRRVEPQPQYREERPRYRDHDDDNDHGHGQQHRVDDERSGGHSSRRSRQHGSWLTDLLEGIGGGD